MVGIGWGVLRLSWFGLGSLYKMNVLSIFKADV